MRPHKLEFSGLHSFKDLQKIDFDALSARGVFGIFGPTGSGKTSILDALTLALYGRINRSNRNIDFVNSASTETFVKLTFSTEKKKVFEVSRIYSIKKTKKSA